MQNKADPAEGARKPPGESLVVGSFDQRYKYVMNRCNWYWDWIAYVNADKIKSSHIIKICRSSLIAVLLCSGGTTPSIRRSLNCAWFAAKGSGRINILAHAPTRVPVSNVPSPKWLIPSNSEDIQNACWTLTARPKCSHQVKFASTDISPKKAKPNGRNSNPNATRSNTTQTHSNNSAKSKDVLESLPTSDVSSAKHTTVRSA